MKDLNYYMDLKYPIEIMEITPEQGGGFQASIPQLGKYAFVGDGGTIQEALENLNTTKAELFEKYLQSGTPIPGPEADGKVYSGETIQ